ncbi:MAG: HD domain-containing protein [Candidatus Rokubacteria bacterium]|nr:HD domain-containing protein [Candidatus Rokubacteria bacterium]
MSDLVRGIHREVERPPTREAPPARRPSAGAPPQTEESLPASRVRFPTEPAAPSAAGPAKPEPSPAREASPAEPEGQDRAEEIFALLLAFTGQLPALVREGGEFPWGAFERLVERAIHSLGKSAEVFWQANNPPAAGVEYLAAHLAQVGILSLRIGVGVGYDRERLLDLGMAAFLFDVGLVELPEGLLRKAEPLSAEDRAAYQTHPRRSADIVGRWNPSRAGVTEVVLQHHERENGRGYPQGLAGSAIHPNAKIIGLADTYMGLVYPRPPASRLQPHQAIRQIVSSKHEDVPTPLIKALLAEISVFPPRTVVRLNTGEVGRVTAVNRNHPLRPKVEILTDSRGNRLAVAKILDLAEAPFIYVTGPVKEGEG